ncbi:MAG: GIY-YIG nuclease family protein [bacterium]|nr:GIY-YIG nuclease family protein [bacterium]
MSYFVYAIHGSSRNYKYIGITDNIDRRLQQHNRGYNKIMKIYTIFL